MTKPYDKFQAKTRILQGQSSKIAGSSFVLWAGDSDDSAPIAVLGKGPGPSSDATDELKIVNGLREWGRAYVRTLATIPQRNPFLHTVLSLEQAVSNKSLRISFDLVCHLRGSVLKAREQCFSCRTVCIRIRFLV